MKRKAIAAVLTVLLLTALFTVTAYAENAGDINADLHWAYDETTHTLTISGTGPIPDFQEGATPWNALNGEINSLEVKSGVTAIGANAFAGITLTSAKVPCSLAGSVTAASLELTHNNLTETPAVAPTMTQDGTKAYYTCPDCSKMFSDAAGTTEITAPVKDPKLDQTAPTLLVAYLNSGTVLLPATTAGASVVTVTVITDDSNQSGCVSGSVTFTNGDKSTKPTVSCTLYPDSSAADTLTGTLMFADSMLAGNYTLSEITLMDGAGNAAAYTNQQLPALSQNLTVTVYRSSKATTISTLTLNTTSIGYGGVVTGTVTLKDSSGNGIAGKSLDVYVSGTKTGNAIVTDAAGTATFTYSNSVAGTYSIEAKFQGDDDYEAAASTPVVLTVNSVPATGDHYHLLLWSCVAVLAVGVNAWFFLRRRSA